MWHCKALRWYTSQCDTQAEGAQSCRTQCTWSGWMYFDYIRTTLIEKENFLCYRRIYAIYLYEMSNETGKILPIRRRLRSCKFVWYKYIRTFVCVKNVTNVKLSPPAEVLPSNPPPPPEDSANPTLYRWQSLSWQLFIFTIIIILEVTMRQSSSSWYGRELSGWPIKA